mmetsp:Transcript_5712/g.17443  ORF Transcript_5712/g.17443 Transcript_5712/m.17443 type:complete len:326 (-) Transcript_5712:256-1233(-)
MPCHGQLRVARAGRRALQRKLCHHDVGGCCRRRPPAHRYCPPLDRCRLPVRWHHLPRRDCWSVRRRRPVRQAYPGLQRCRPRHQCRVHRRVARRHRRRPTHSAGKRRPTCGSVADAVDAGGGGGGGRAPIAPAAAAASAAEAAAAAGIPAAAAAAVATAAGIPAPALHAPAVVDGAASASASLLERPCLPRCPRRRRRRRHCWYSLRRARLRTAVWRLRLRLRHHCPRTHRSLTPTMALAPTPLPGQRQQTPPACAAAAAPSRAPAQTRRQRWAQAQGAAPDARRPVPPCRTQRCPRSPYRTTGQPGTEQAPRRMQDRRRRCRPC